VIQGSALGSLYVHRNEDGAAHVHILDAVLTVLCVCTVCGLAAHKLSQALGACLVRLGCGWASVHQR
jgi:hypothetical protein